MIEIIEIEKVKENPENPRFINPEQFKKLVKSIKDFPEMLGLRPLVVDEDLVVLGGNMRLKAAKEAGLKTISIQRAGNLTEEQKKEFVIKDNSSFGEWDWKVLQEDWNIDLLEDWGLKVIKHDWDNLEEIMEDLDMPLPGGDKHLTIKIVVSETYKDQMDEIKGVIIEFLTEKYPDCDFQ